MIFMRFFFSDFLYKRIGCRCTFELHPQIDAIQMGTTTYAFLYKSIYCGYSFESHRKVDESHIGTHNICLYNEADKKVHWL